MSNHWVVLSLTVALIAASAFFVAVEFSVIVARRNRLEDAAATSSPARATLRSKKELSLVLAGSQLGITACTLALGATTKPAVHYWLTPQFHAWGCPVWVADAAGFALALAIVTFLHLVVGEMAPKSWAIAHPERSAILVALPMRVFMAPTRPLLKLLNRSANWLLHRLGVSPVDEVTAPTNTDTLRHLVEHSAIAGALEQTYFQKLTRALELDTLTVGDIVSPDVVPSCVSASAGPAEIQAEARRTGHLRLLVTDDDASLDDVSVIGVVHIRDSLRGPSNSTARELMRPVLTLTARTPVYRALKIMRQTRHHLAQVTELDASRTGLITLTDVMKRLLSAADLGNP